ncbi:MAG: glucose-6-phosphate isomerase [Pseudomonadota bacterium]
MTFSNDKTASETLQPLQTHRARLGDTTIAQLFDKDTERGRRMVLEAAGLRLDYSKNRVDELAIEALLEAAREAGVAQAREAMFAGQHINNTENRAVLHVALRDRSERKILVDGQDAVALARDELDRALEFTESVVGGEHKGYSGESIDTVVNIGIGGSDLGPRMATAALKSFWLPGRQAHFVSNVDGQDLQDVLAKVDPARTLFLIASKTFTTQETMTNARSARTWFLAQGAPESAIGHHFVALSTNLNAVAEFGIAPERTFGFWDWVGGRYSLWSVIGLPIALQVGRDSFYELLAGAQAMDEHFRTKPLEQNMPLLLALMGVWNRNIEEISSHAVLPYDQRLALLPSYLQQADMESNGKSVDRSGRAVGVGTSPVLFGEPGTNGQHAFYQMLHQGTDRVACDFIAAAQVGVELGDHHLKLLANFLAQPRALMRGKSFDEARRELVSGGYSEAQRDALAAHRSFPGNRPSNAILMQRLTPSTLGALLALYEHKIFCQGVIWGINSFDQWGVELGKTMANMLLPMLSEGDKHAVGREEGGDKGENALLIDSSTQNMLQWIRKTRSRA